MTTQAVIVEAVATGDRRNSYPLLRLSRRYCRTKRSHDRWSCKDPCQRSSRRLSSTLNLQTFCQLKRLIKHALQRRRRHDHQRHPCHCRFEFCQSRRLLLQGPGISEDIQLSNATKPDPHYLGVARDGVWLHLQSYKPERAGMTDAFLWVVDVDRLHENFPREVQLCSCHTPIRRGELANWGIRAPTETCLSSPRNQRTQMWPRRCQQRRLALPVEFHTSPWTPKPLLCF